MSWIYVDYRCPKCGRVWESLEERPAPPTQPCDCGDVAEKQMPAPLGRVKLGEVRRGVSDERPPHALDTRPYARRHGVDI